MRLSRTGRIAVGTVWLMLATVPHAADKSDFTAAQAAAFKGQMTERCTREQRAMAGNKRMSDLMLSRTCECISNGMVVAASDGLLDGLDKARRNDVFWGRANRLLLACTRELVPDIPPNPRWVSAVAGPESEMFIDAESVERKGSTSSVTQLENFAVARVLPGTPVGVRSMIMRGEFNCLAGRLRSVFFYAFSEPMARGILVTTEQSTGEWQSVEVGTSREKLWLAVCKGS